MKSLRAGSRKFLRGIQQQQAMASMQYWLSKDFFLRAIGDQVICFDVRDASYLTFKAELFAAASGRIHGWPCTTGAAPVRACAAIQPAEVLVSLANQGVLVTERSLGKLAIQIATIPPRGELMPEYDLDPPVISYADWLRFARAALYAWVTIGIWGRHTVRRLKRGSTGVMDTELTSLASAEEIGQLRRTASVFMRLKPILPMKKNSEFFQRLVLFRLLVTGGHRPTWIHGVSVDPFRTRSWLQIGDTVIDAAHGALLSFAPIYALYN